MNHKPIFFLFQGKGEARGYLPSPQFGQSINPIPTMGTGNAHHIATFPRIFRPYASSACDMIR